MSNDPQQPAFIAPAPEDLTPLFPGYEIHNLIAVGGMGAVYCAVQKSLDRTVALKILPMEFSEDVAFCEGFEAEAKAMARLNHPNLIGVHDFGEVNGMLFIVMELVHGKSLYHSANSLKIHPSEAARLVTGICNGLSHAHENGILHRDIKPSNILLTLKAEPKIGDFGLARPVERKSQKGEVIFGTPGYTAPEVVNAPETVDHRADLFSVGVLLHELLTGRLPAVDLRPASMICGCDSRFDAIIRRATHPLPSNRYSSAKEIATELQVITTARAIVSGTSMIGKARLGGGSRHIVPSAKVPATAELGEFRPPQPVRAVSAHLKRKSAKLTWIGPLVAIAIIAYSWHTFANMKPRIEVLGRPAVHAAASSPRDATELLNFARNTPDTRSALSAYQALRPVAGDDQLEALLSVAQFGTNPELKKVAEECAIDLIKRSANKGKLLGSVASAIKSTTNVKIKATLTRIQAAAK